MVLTVLPARLMETAYNSVLLAILPIFCTMVPVSWSAHREPPENLTLKISWLSVNRVKSMKKNAHNWGFSACWTVLENGSVLKTALQAFMRIVGSVKLVQLDA